MLPTLEPDRPWDEKAVCHLRVHRQKSFPEGRWRLCSIRQEFPNPQNCQTQIQKMPDKSKINPGSPTAA
jgi:hypothetical protein